jgi:hypothetical protein
MILYHGSNIEIETINLSKCKPFKDFGRGFYTTPLQEQAWTMAKRTARIYRTGNPCVTEFFLADDLVSDVVVKIKRFDEPNNVWAQFVVNNRNHKFQNIANLDCNADGKYDIVIGPVANDDIAALIDVYLTGLISDEALTKELAFRELSRQVSFHTEKSIALLRKTGVCYE